MTEEIRSARTAQGAPRACLSLAFTCPACGRIMHGATPRTGESWFTCSHRRATLGCAGHWLNVVLTPGTTGYLLAGRFGTVVAHALAELLRRDLAADDRWLTHEFHAWTAQEPAHLQILTTRRDEHRYRYAPLDVTLCAIGVVASGAAQRGAA